MLNREFGILTLDEAIKIIGDLNRQKLKPTKTGLYIELKNPQYAKGLGYEPEKALMKVLHNHNIYDVAKASNDVPIIIQCFDPETLKNLSKMTDLPLVQLMSPTDPVDVDQIQKYLSIESVILAMLMESVLTLTKYLRSMILQC